ncbi:MAG TPA: hypothetical protein VHB98_09635 [Chloroflexota bacterium]|nr:hypothetical protein [Chloroflexota bacterium]
MNAPRSYHQFLGNGIDAVLLGPSGAMTAEPAHDLDRCYWYKADTYYADARRFAPGDDPTTFLDAPPGGTNFQLAPLGRAWFEVLDAGHRPLPLLRSTQQFSPSAGLLTTQAIYEGVTLTVQTTLAVILPALLFDLSADRDLTLRAYAAPGLWPDDAEQVEPATACLPLAGTVPGWRYQVGAHTCNLRLVPVSGCHDAGTGAQDAWLRLTGRRLRWWAVLECSRYPDERGSWQRLPLLAPAQSMHPGVAIPRSTAPVGEQARVMPADATAAAGPTSANAPADPAVGPQVELPDEDYQRLHAFSMYMFRAMQHRYSGGLPVNNLRRTFNSHVFWDGAFVQRALLEAGQVAPAREAWRFLARTREAAAANARDTFDAPGLHWDWETTHQGERAYIPWLQQRFQVHNTPLLAHMIMADYRATRDLAVLEEGYPLLAGAATFLLHAVLVEEAGRLVTRPLVGSHEAAQPVVNDGATVAASLRLLLDVALAARLLGRYDGFARRCAVAAHQLRGTLASLFNGRYFQASRDQDRLNTSSLAPIYPAGVIAPADPRAMSTVAAYQRRYPNRMAGHGNNEQGFPWSAGILARLLAFQGRVDAAWQQLDLARTALCVQGGCAEYVDAQGRWNNQYFSTAQAALCSALHALLLQAHGAELRLFPALPAHWQRCGFRDFLVDGVRLDARYDRGAAEVVVRNACARPRRIRLRFGAHVQLLTLGVGECRTLELGGRDDRA